MRSKRKDIKRSYDDIIHNLYISIYKDLCIYDVYIYTHTYIYIHIYSVYVYIYTLWKVCINDITSMFRLIYTFVRKPIASRIATSVGSALMEVAQMIQVLDVFVLVNRWRRHGIPHDLRKPHIYMDQISIQYTMFLEDLQCRMNMAQQRPHKFLES